MERVLFTEEQKFDQVWIRVMIIIAWIPLLLIFGVGIFRQLVQGKPWGNHPASNTGLVVAGALAFLVMAVLTWLMFTLRMITEVTGEGLRYRFPPLLLRHRTIPGKEIADYSIREYNPVREYGGWGIRQGGHGNGRAYNVKGNTGLQLRLHDGKKILFGTQRPDALRLAMDKMMKPTLI